MGRMPVMRAFAILFALCAVPSAGAAQCELRGANVRFRDLVLPTGQVIELAEIERATASVSLRHVLPSPLTLQLVSPIEARAEAAAEIRLTDAHVLGAPFFEDAARSFARCARWRFRERMVCPSTSRACASMG